MAKKYLENISFKNENLVIRDAEAQTAISNLQSNVSTISETVANHSTHLNVVDERIAENTADIDALERLTENHEARLDTAEDDIASLNADMSEAKSALFDIDGRLDVVETSVSGIENRLSDAEDDITTLKTRVTENENNIDTLQHDSAILQVDVGELQEWKKDTDERLDDMDDRITASTYEAGEGIYFGRGDTHTNINVEDELLAEIHGASDGVRKLFADLGTDFVDGLAYYNGDYVLHDGYLYRFDNPTPLAGTWDVIGGAFTRVTTSAELKRIAGQSGGDSSVVIIEFTTGTYPAEMTYTTIKGYVDDGKTVLLYNTGTTYIYQLAQIDTYQNTAVFTHLETFIATRKSSNMKILVTDTNVVLANDELITLPASTLQDAGKVLKVDSAGAWGLGDDEGGTTVKGEATCYVTLSSDSVYSSEYNGWVGSSIEVNGRTFTNRTDLNNYFISNFPANTYLYFNVTVPSTLPYTTLYNFFRFSDDLSNVAINVASTLAGRWMTSTTEPLRVRIDTTATPPVSFRSMSGAHDMDTYEIEYPEIFIGTGLAVDSNNKLNVIEIESKSPVNLTAITTGSVTAAVIDNRSYVDYRTGTVYLDFIYEATAGSSATPYDIATGAPIPYYNDDTTLKPITMFPCMMFSNGTVVPGAGFGVGVANVGDTSATITVVGAGAPAPGNIYHIVGTYLTMPRI